MKVKLKFLGDAYTARSVNVAAERTINLYPEVDPHNQSIIALFGTEGLLRKVTLATSPVRALFVFESVLYAVGGNKFYTVNTSYVATERGTLNTSTGFVSMATNGLDVLVVDGTNGYLYNIASPAFAVISDVDYPDTASVCEVQDTFFIVSGDGTQKFYTSPDGTAWDGLDFASAEGKPDNIVSMLSDHRELWLFGENTTEVWQNTGNPDFTFERVNGAFIEHGCAAKASVAKMDNTVFWIGKDDRGIGIVWKAAGYSPARVSTHAIEYAISQHTPAEIAASRAYTYQNLGHSFYVLTIGDETWVYDAATNMWHQRAYTVPETGVLIQHRSICYSFFNDKHVVGDYENGKIYELDLDTYSDDGDEISSIRACRHIIKDRKKARHNSLELVMESGVGLVTGQGSDPQVMLRFSDDGGHAWSSETWGYLGNAIGAVGEYSTRVIFRRLGASRNRIYEASITDPVKRVFVDAVLDTDEGTT